MWMAYVGIYLLFMGGFWWMFHSSVYKDEDFDIDNTDERA